MVGALITETDPLRAVRDWDNSISAELADSRSADTADWHASSPEQVTRCRSSGDVSGDDRAGGERASGGRWSFLPTAMVVEITTFLIVNHLVGRERPPVERIGPLPGTYSFPSGHVAATLVCWGGISLLLAVYGSAVGPDRRRVRCAHDRGDGVGTRLRGHALHDRRLLRLRDGSGRACGGDGCHRSAAGAAASCLNGSAGGTARHGRSTRASGYPRRRRHHRAGHGGGVDVAAGARAAVAEHRGCVPVGERRPKRGARPRVDRGRRWSGGTDGPELRRGRFREAHGAPRWQDSRRRIRRG